MGSNKSSENNVNFVGINTGGFNVRSTRVSQEVEMQQPKRAKGVKPSEPVESEESMASRRAAEEAERAEAEQRLREKIREELTAEVEASVRASLEKEASKKTKKSGLAKASPKFKNVEPSAKASELDLEEAVKKNSEEVSD